MKMLVFAARNRKELLRDPLNLAFGIGFPLVLLFLLSAIQANIPMDLFQIEKLVPGVAVFGLSFISLFSGVLIAKDRNSSFLMRLFTSPMSAREFIGGYTMPLLPMALAQSAICFGAALFLGLTLSSNILLAIAVLIPVALLFIGIGLWAGSVFNEKQVSGICGALLTNVSAWLSGTWFELDLVGGAFKRIAYLLPFAHGVEATRASLSGQYSAIFPHLWWVVGYAVVVLAIAILAFRRKMNGEQA